MTLNDVEKVTNVEFEVQLTLEDFKNAQELHIKASRWLEWCAAGMILFVLGLFVFAVYKYFAEGKLLALMIGLGITIILVTVWVTVLMPWQFRRTWRQSKTLHDGYRMNISESGVFTDSKYGHWLLPWSDFLKWRENEHVYLIYLTDAHFEMIPTRLLTKEQMDQMRQILTAHLPQQA